MLPETREQKVEAVQRLKAVAHLDPRVKDPADIWIVPFTEDDVAAVYTPKPLAYRCTVRNVTHILNNIANTGVIYNSVLGSGMSIPSFERIKGEHPGLKELAELAMVIHAQLVDNTVRCRAIHGVLEDVTFQGQVTAQKRVFSDRLLELYAKRRCPEYRDKSSVDVNVSGGVLLTHAAAISKEEWLEKHSPKKLSE